MKRRARRAASGIYHRRIAPSEFRVASYRGEKVLEGYASVFGSVNSYSERFHEGAFARSIKESDTGKGPKIVHLLHHDERLLFGMPTLGEDSKGFEFRTAPLDTSTAKQGLIEMEAGGLGGVSIGFSFRKNGATWNETDEVLDVSAARVFEISSVRWGSDPNALGGIVERSRFAKRLDGEDGGCNCSCNDEDADEQRGASLGALLNGAVDELVDDETTREDIVAQLAEASDLEPENVESILSGDVDCPDPAHLAAFAEVLGLSMELIEEALIADGCVDDEGDEEEAVEDEEVTEDEEERSILYQLTRRRFDLATPAKERAAIDALLMQMTKASTKPRAKKRTKKKTTTNLLSEIHNLSSFDF